MFDCRAEGSSPRVGVLMSVPPPPLLLLSLLSSRKRGVKEKKRGGVSVSKKESDARRRTPARNTHALVAGVPATVPLVAKVGRGTVIDDGAIADRQHRYV